MITKSAVPHFFVLILILAAQTSADEIAQYRGPDRNGVFPETDLLKEWPDSGPMLLWSKTELDRGFASPSVTGDRIYLAGRQGNDEFLTLLDLDGNQLWRLKYGQGVGGSYPDTRCTPTVEGNRIYVISGKGQVVCIDSQDKKIVWSVPAFEKFQGESWKWDIAESPLIVDDKVIYTPGGNLTSMVALSKKTGHVIWQSKSLKNPSAFVSPILIEFGDSKIIVNVLTDFIIGVDATDGKILWQTKYADIDPPTWHETARRNNCVTPLYHDGQLFVTSGYDHVGVMFKLVNQGTGIEQLWINKDLDNHHGQVVRVGSYIYGSNWIDNRHGNWCCVDWKTGKTLYETTWHNKGPISAADGMLYCYDEKDGNLGLVKADPSRFSVAGSLVIGEGSGPHWTQPVIKNGVLYIRHGDALMAFDVKKIGSE